MTELTRRNAGHGRKASFGRSFVTALAFLLLLAFSPVNAAGLQNISLNYVYNGTDWVPWLATADGKPKVDLNLLNITTGNLTVDTNVLFVNSATDRVGIGTISPASTLHVVGTANITQTLFIEGINISGRQLSDNTTLAAMLGQKLNLTGGTLSGLLTGTFGTFANGLNVTAGGLIVAAGNVGIGTTRPEAILNTYGDGTRIQMNSSTGGGQTGIKFGTPNENITSEILIDTANFAFRNTQTGSLTTKMYISGETGNVGIGTTSPNNAKVHIDQTTAGAWALRVNQSHATDSPGLILTVAEGTSGTNAALRVISGTTNIFEVKSTGNVGIGTTGPGEKLHVVGDLKVVSDSDVSGTLGSGIIYTQNTGGTEGVHIDTNEIQTVGGDLYLQNEGAQDLNVGNGDLFVETTGGNVGIGTTGPGVKLQINGDSNGAAVDILRLTNPNSAAGTGARMSFSAADVDDFAAIEARRTEGGGGDFGGRLLFYTEDDAGTLGEKMRIDKTGNVGIGTTVGTINARLDIDGGIEYDAPAGLTSSNTICWDNTDAGYGGQYIGKCASSIIYKTNVTDYTRGLETLKKLRPVEFNWKRTGERDLGFIAEEVETVDPILVVHDSNGTAESVKYDQITALLVNSIKELKAENDGLKAKNEELEKRISALENGGKR